MAKATNSKDNMALCTISGPLDNFGLAVRDFVINRPFHPENAVSFTQEITLLPMNTDNPHEETLKTADKLLTELGIKPSYKPFNPKEMRIKTTLDYFGNLLTWFNALHDERRRLHSVIDTNNNIIDILNHIKQVDVAMDKLLNMKVVKFRFGKIPTNIFNHARQRINLREDLFFIHTSMEENYVYGMYFAIPSAAERADAFFTALKFERIWISNKVHGSPGEAAKMITEENQELSHQLADLDTKKSDMRNQEYDRFLQHYSYLRLVGDSYGYRSFAGQKDGRFYLVGWIPLTESDIYAQSVNASEGLSCDIKRPEDLTKDSNQADNQKFLQLLKAEEKARSLYDYAMKQEDRLTLDISESSKALRDREYSQADIYLSKARAQEQSQADRKIENLNDQLQSDLDKLKLHYEERRKEWSDTIFNAAINLN